MLPRLPGQASRDLSRRIESVKVLVDARLAGQRLDVALATVLTWRSRASVLRLIDAGLVTVDARRVAPAKRVRAGEIIAIEIPVDPVAVPDDSAPIALRVVYEDVWMVAVDKPPGMAVHPSGRHLSGTLMQELHRRYRRPAEPAHDVVPRLLHRIDLETSGLVAVGLDERFHQLVGRQFEDRLVRKRYLAVVHGTPSPREGTIDLPIAHDKTSAVRLKLRAGAVGEGLPAVTHYRVERSNDRFSLVAVMPRTGRTHQIRVHFAAIGCPIVGDKLYGPDEQFFLRHIQGTLAAEERQQLVLDRHALHSHSLAFHHPMLGREIELVAPLPEDMRALVE